MNQAATPALPSGFQVPGFAPTSSTTEPPAAPSTTKSAAPVRARRASAAQPSRPQRSARISWAERGYLPEVAPEPGYGFRWISTSVAGMPMAERVAAATSAGWVPVKLSEHPELHGYANLHPKADGTHYDNVEIGGLLLCKMPTEYIKEDVELIRQKTKAQMNGVDNAALRTLDKRMPLVKPSRTSDLEFGKGPSRRDASAGAEGDSGGSDD